MTYSGRAYDSLVDEGKTAVLAESQYQWTLGDLAVEVVGPAGSAGQDHSGELLSFAEDIGVDYQRLKEYRVVASAWPKVARATLVPWVNYRTVYKVKDREDVMASFVAKYNGSTADRKPSYRNFQRHIGKDATREYSKANTKETAEQALEDLPAKDQGEVIAPRMADPAVTKIVMDDPEAATVIVNERVRRIHEQIDHAHDERMLERAGSSLIDTEADLSEIRWRLRCIYDRRDHLQPVDREPVAQSLTMISQRAEVLADVIRHPETATITEQDLDLLQEGRS